MPLTVTEIRNRRAEDKPIKLFDGGGLFLLVTPQGGKWWRLKYRFDGKEKLLSLGASIVVCASSSPRKQALGFRT